MQTNFDAGIKNTFNLSSVQFIGNAASPLLLIKTGQANSWSASAEWFSGGGALRRASQEPAAERRWPSAGEPEVQQGEVLRHREAVFIAEEHAPDGDHHHLSREGEEGVNLLRCHLDVRHF